MNQEEVVRETLQRLMHYIHKDCGGDCAYGMCIPKADVAKYAMRVEKDMRQPKQKVKMPKF